MVTGTSKDKAMVTGAPLRETSLYNVELMVISPSLGITLVMGRSALLFGDQAMGTGTSKDQGMQIGVPLKEIRPFSVEQTATSQPQETILMRESYELRSIVLATEFCTSKEMI